MNVTKLFRLLYLLLVLCDSRNGLQVISCYPCFPGCESGHLSCGNRVTWYPNLSNETKITMLSISLIGTEILSLPFLEYNEYPTLEIFIESANWLIDCESVRQWSVVITQAKFDSEQCIPPSTELTNVIESTVAVNNSTITTTEFINYTLATRILYSSDSTQLMDNVTYLVNTTTIVSPSSTFTFHWLAAVIFICCTLAVTSVFIITWQKCRASKRAKGRRIMNFDSELYSISELTVIELDEEVESDVI